MGAVTIITDTSFEAEVEQSTIPVVVDFWAEWCGPCKMMAPVLESMATKLGDSVKFLKLNVDDNPKTASSFGIFAIPTLVLFKNGKEAGRHSGFLPEEQLKKFVGAHL